MVYDLPLERLVTVLLLLLISHQLTPPMIIANRTMSNVLNSESSEMCSVPTSALVSSMTELCKKQKKYYEFREDEALFE